MDNETHKGYVVDHGALPHKYPTHLHDAAFWESLGRTVATFGFLEKVLSKAIFAFTATRPYKEHEIEQAYMDWLTKLEHTLTDQLGSLIDTYGKSVREHPQATIEDLDFLLDELRQASKIRNVLCHGSWGLPNANGASIPFFVNRKLEVFDTAVDCQFLDQVQASVSELASLVISTVTHMGYQFPGSTGPGKPV